MAFISFCFGDEEQQALYIINDKILFAMNIRCVHFAALVLHGGLLFVCREGAGGEKMVKYTSVTKYYTPVIAIFPLSVVATGFSCDFIFTFRSSELVQCPVCTQGSNIKQHSKMHTPNQLQNIRRYFFLHFSHPSPYISLPNNNFNITIKYNFFFCSLQLIYDKM